MKYVKALSEVTAKNRYGLPVSWPAKAILPIEDDQLAFFTEHSDVFTVLGIAGPLPLQVAKSAVAASLIAAAITFTTLTIETNAGKTRLVSDGIHSLTTNPAVGKRVYVTWTGAGHTGVDGFYEILAVDTTKKITIDLAYSATLGTPTIALAGDTVTLETITVPADVMGTTGELDITALVSHTDSANDKTLSILFGGTTVTTYVATSTTSTSIAKKISNRTAATQVTSALGAIGPGSDAGAVVTAAIDTTAAVTVLIKAALEVENEVVQIERYAVTATT